MLPSAPAPHDGRLPAPSWLSLDPRARQQFDKSPFTIGHRLAEQPLLTLPALIELARRLPADSVEYNAGDLPLNQDPALTPRTGLSIQDTLRDIETCRSWMVLKNIEQQSPYRKLVDECLDEVEAALGPLTPGMCARQGFVFVSSPQAVTPYHADFEYNFLLQIRGTKVVTVWEDQNRRLLSEEDRERVATGGARNLPFEDSFLTEGRPFELRPGQGLHVPLSAPHCVRVADDVSISLSITFQSSVSHRVLSLHKANRWLRGHGITPRQVGASPLADSLKFNAWRVMNRLRVIDDPSTRDSAPSGSRY